MVRRAGVLVPLFSIYSSKSIGIGEFEDLKLLIDWCVTSGNSIVQLLPMNEMGPLSCPYDSISSFALEPVYISLRCCGQHIPEAIHSQCDTARQKFPVRDRYVDYRLKAEKLRVLWEIYKHEGSQHSEACRSFVREQHYWIDDYALYKVLKDHHKGKPWYEWEEGYTQRDHDRLTQFKQDNQEVFRFHQWVQWHAYQQFTAVKEYAMERGVLIKGDLPILVSRDSADVWAQKESFKLELASGAPPDMYCAKGQRWGMPPYNWQAIAAKKYRYIKEKLKYAEHFYSLLRIDHVVGLFRIWSIPVDEPMENQGLNGFFDPSDEHVWKHHGRSILQHMMDGTTLSFCGEDLGVIPPVCTETLKEFKIPGIDVQRWTKGWSTTHCFLSPDEYRVLSVAVLSTHDTTNFPAWWENEAGTIDDLKFQHMCAGRVDYAAVKERLFDKRLSKHGRLRWADSVDSVECLVDILGKPAHELNDFIEAYQNSYHEKEELWRLAGLKGAMKEKADSALIKAAVTMTLQTPSVYCIQLIIDWLYAVGDIFQGDPFQYSINKPGTISDHNWSLRLPVSLEKMVAHPGVNTIRKLIIASNRKPVLSRPGKKTRARV